MPTALIMTTGKVLAISVAAERPEGARVEYESSDNGIVGVVPDPVTGVADLYAIKAGSATITATPMDWINAPPADVVQVKVVEPAPRSLNLTVGAPTDE